MNRCKKQTFNHFVHTLHSLIPFPLTTQSNLLVTALEFNLLHSHQSHVNKTIVQYQDQDRKKCPRGDARPRQ